MTQPNVTAHTERKQLPIEWVDSESFPVPCKLRQEHEPMFPPSSILITATPEIPLAPTPVARPSAVSPLAP